MKNEPKNFRDFKWYKETSENGRKGELSSKVVTRLCDAKVGDVANQFEYLSCSDESIAVGIKKEVVCEVNGNKTVLQLEFQRIEEFDDFEKFKKSSWYKKAMKLWGDGGTDSTWMDDVYLESDDSDIFLEFKYAGTYTDSLNNTRLSKEVKDASIRLSKVGGKISVDCDEADFDTTLVEIKEALEFKRKMDKLGISLNGEHSISVDLRRRDK